MQKELFQKGFIKLMDGYDVREQAWYLSKPNTEKKEDILYELDKMDAQIGTLKQLVFHIKSSVLFRELLTSFRPYSMWAMSSRVNPVEQSYYIMDGIPHNEDSLKWLEEEHQSLLSQEKQGQDIDRLKLKLCSGTEYYYGTDYRTWMVIMKTIQNRYPEVADYYFQEMSEDKYKDPSYPYRALDMRYPENLKDHDEMVETSQFKIIPFKMSLTHRSHFARHMGVQIKDDLWNHPYAYLQQQDFNFSLRGELCGSKQFLDRVVSTRSCFTEDTKVALVDGRDLTMKEIHEEYGTDKPFWVFAYDGIEHKVVKTEAYSHGIKGYRDTFLQVHLDNGFEVTCTPDHKWLLENGSYIPAYEFSMLGEDRSLMSLYGTKENPSLRHLSFTSVKTLELKAKAVYDLGVPKYHNYALASGVFVHNCWMLDFRLWSDFVTSTIKDVDTLKEFLPCRSDSEKCIYALDHDNRLTGADPNLPCPIKMQDPSFIEKRERETGKDNKLLNLYKDLF